MSIVKKLYQTGIKLRYSSDFHIRKKIVLRNDMVAFFSHNAFESRSLFYDYFIPYLHSPLQ